MRNSLVLVLSTVILTGCGAPSYENLTWQEAKDSAQEMSLSLADSIPNEVVEKVDQKASGTLLSCDGGRYNWNGFTTVLVKGGTDIETVLKNIEEEYADSRFLIKTRLDSRGDYELQLRAPDTAEIYLIGKDQDNIIGIDAGSACFTLPEGVYPGGAF